VLCKRRERTQVQHEAETPDSHSDGPRVGGGSFVITTWRESDAAQGGEWRFRVVHVQSSETVYFHCIADVLGYIGKKAGGSPPA